MKRIIQYVFWFLLLTLLLAPVSCGSGTESESRSESVSECISEACVHEGLWQVDEKATSALTGHATCIKSGNAVYVCTGCGETKTEFVKSLGHNPEKHEEVPATCLSGGTVEYYLCLRCEYYFGDEKCKTKLGTVEIAPLGHSFVGQAKKNPTCTEDGRIECYQCKSCKLFFAKKTDEAQLTYAEYAIAKNGHSIEAVTVKEATCLENGALIDHYACAVCGAVFADARGVASLDASDAVIPATGHAYGEYSTDGKTISHTCLTCKYTESVAAVDTSVSPVVLRPLTTLCGLYYITGAANATVTLTSGAVVYSTTLSANGKGALGVPDASYTVTGASSLTPVNHTCKGIWQEWEEADKSSQGILCRTCEICGEILYVDTPKTGSNTVYYERNETLTEGKPSFSLAVTKNGVYRLAFRYSSAPTGEYVHIGTSAAANVYSCNHMSGYNENALGYDGYSSVVFDVYLTEGDNTVTVYDLRSGTWEISGIAVQLLTEVESLALSTVKGNHDDYITRLSGNGIDPALKLSLTDLTVAEDGIYNFSFLTNAQNGGETIVRLTDENGVTTELRSKSLTDTTWVTWGIEGIITSYGGVALYSDNLYFYDAEADKYGSIAAGNINLKKGTYSVVVTVDMYRFDSRHMFGGALFMSVAD